MSITRYLYFFVTSAIWKIGKITWTFFRGGISISNNLYEIFMCAEWRIVRIVVVF